MSRLSPWVPHVGVSCHGFAFMFKCVRISKIYAIVFVLECLSEWSVHLEEDAFLLAECCGYVSVWIKLCMLTFG